MNCWARFCTVHPTALSRIEFDGGLVLDQADFYREEVTSTGPMRMGVFDLAGERALLKVTMLGTNPAGGARVQVWPGLPQAHALGGGAISVHHRRQRGRGHRSDRGRQAPGRADVRGLVLTRFPPSRPANSRPSWQVRQRCVGIPRCARQSPPISTTKQWTRSAGGSRTLLASDDQRYSAELRKLIEKADDNKGRRLGRPRQRRLSRTSCISETMFSQS